MPNGGGSRSMFRRVKIPEEEQPKEREKRDEVLRVLDKGDYGQVIVHLYKGRVVQIQERWDHRFPKSPNSGVSNDGRHVGRG